MSNVAIHGMEDDDFAYEDEHIELESENQEYDDLAESEFDKQPSAVRAEVKPLFAPVLSVPPPSGPKPTIADLASTLKPTPPPVTAAAVSRPRPPAKKSKMEGTKRQSKVADRPQTHGTKPRKKAKSSSRAATSTIAKKKAPARKKSVATKGKALPVKKAAAQGTAATDRKKTLKPASKRFKGSGAARTKSRKP